MKTLQEYRGLLLLLVLLLILRTFVFRISIVNGKSMENTFFNHNLLFCTIYDKNKIQHSDIVVIKSPYDKRLFVKRVVATPGNLIEFEGSNVILNGEILNEPYIKNPTTYYKNSVHLAEDEYFVLGDNRDNSEDSRYFGAISKNSIVAVVKFKIF